MKSFKKLTTTLVAIVLLLPAVTFAATPPPPIPLLVYGDVSLYGVTVPAGGEISASASGVIIATTSVNSAGKYFFQIPASYAGSTLTYKIGNLVAAEKVCLNPLQYGSDKINLIIAAPPSPPPPPAGGGGGGGGGGSYVPPSSLSAEAQKVDTNKDNKINILDFVTLMANWGKTGAGNIADFNGDGKVDILDFVALMANWTK